MADTDGDGDKDVVVDRTGDETGPGWYTGYYVQLLEQTGARSFSDRTLRIHGNRDSEAYAIDWLRIADIDQDGDPDIFDDNASTGLIWKNDGSGEFRPGLYDVLPPNDAVDEGTSHSLQNPPFSVDHSALRAGRPGRAAAWAYGDFDGDGDIDVFYATVDPGRALPAELYVNDGNGNFSLDGGFMGGSPPTLLGASKALPGDYNGDGRVDVFVTGTGADFGGEAPYVILSSGSGHVAAALLMGWPGLLRRSVGRCGCRWRPGRVSLWPGGVGAAEQRRRVLRSLRPRWSDEYPGADRGTRPVPDRYGACGCRQRRILGSPCRGHEYDEPPVIVWGDSSGVFGASGRTEFPAVTGYGVILDIDAGDFDRDGDMDIVVSRTGDDTGPGSYEGYYLQLVENLGERRFGDATTARMSGNRDDGAGPLRWIRAYDSDGDSDLDLVVDDYLGTDLMWRNDGAGSFHAVHKVGALGPS